MNSPDQPVFSVDAVARSFRGKHVLVSASAWVHAGRTTALVGRNGCGKSTLLRVATGGIRAKRGVVQVGGRRTTRPRMHRLARLGVFYWTDQNLLPLDEPVGRLFQWVSRRVPGAAVEEALDVCGLEALLGMRTRKLSGGERRRVELGLVLARQPRVLLADEPFLGVMPSDRRYLLDVFAQLKARGAGILVTGHEVDTLFEVADDVIWMTAGTTHHLGSPAEAAAHDQFGREYLGPRGDGLAEKAGPG